ncbi:MAG: hypothetical protein HW389_228 [Bacteroidetes bacterium]|nr:hypothetical protein [Bacteroidota bacterium]
MVFNSAFLLRFGVKQPRLQGKFSAIVLAPLDSFAYFPAPCFQLSHEDTKLRDFVACDCLVPQIND